MVIRTPRFMEEANTSKDTFQRVQEDDNDNSSMWQATNRDSRELCAAIKDDDEPAGSESATAEYMTARSPSLKRVAAFSMVGLVAVVLLVGFFTRNADCVTRIANTQEEIELETTSRAEFVAKKLAKVTSKDEAEKLVQKVMEVGSKQVEAKWEATKGSHAAPLRRLSAPPRKLPNSFIKGNNNQGIAACTVSAFKAYTAAMGIGNDINAMVRTCPPPRPGASELACEVNSGMLVTWVGQMASTLSLAVSECAETANIDAICSAGVTGMVSALGQLAATASLVGPVCKPGGPGPLPTSKISELGDQTLGGGAPAPAPAGVTRSAAPSKPSGPLGPSFPAASDLDTTRRLLIGSGTAGNYVQCYIDVSMVAEHFSDFGIALNSAVNSGNCDPSKFSGNQGLVESLCTVDIAGAITYFLEAVTFIQLSIVQCSDKLQLAPLCGASVTGITTAVAAVAPYGAAIHAGCADNALAKQVTGGGRRLETGDAFRRLNDVLGQLNATYTSMGGDVNKIPSLKDQAGMPAADVNKLLDLVEPAVNGKTFRGTMARQEC